MPATKSITSPARHIGIEAKEGYRVGDDGSIWSCIKSRRGDRVVFGEWKQLKPHPQSRGHCTVELGRGDIRFVHRLVLEAFVGPCPEGMECRHLDGNPGNNALWNLAWGTPKRNGEDRIRHGTTRCKLTEEDVIEIRRSRAMGMSAAGLAATYGVSDIHVRQVCRGISRPLLPSQIAVGEHNIY